MAEWVLGWETEEWNSSTAKMHSMEADRHRLSDQVGQLQSKLDRAAFHRLRDLIVGMELQKKDLECVQTAAGDTRRKTLSNLWYT